LVSNKLFQRIIVTRAFVIKTIILISTQKPIFINKSLMKCIQIIIWHHCQAGVTFTFSGWLLWSQLQWRCHWVGAKTQIRFKTASDQSNIHNKPLVQVVRCHFCKKPGSSQKDANIL
jgi:hypothetical protein